MVNGLTSGKQRLCRLCATAQFELCPIFGDGTPDLAEKIYDCTAIEISNADALICQQCRSRIVINHHFVVSCQNANRKFHRMFGSLVRQHIRMSVDGLGARSVTQDVRRVGGGDKPLALPKAVPTKNVANGAVPAKHYLLQRLTNDDQLRRRHSINEDRKVKPKREVKRRLSEESHISIASIELAAAKIEESLSTDIAPKTEAGRQKCPKCGHLVLNLQKHLDLHSTITKYLCEICNKSLTKRCNLKYHMNLHTGEKPYRCRACGLKFTCPSKLWAHRKLNRECGKIHKRSKSYRYSCNGCTSVFKHRKLIEEHMRTSHPDRKHPCETCGRAYVTRKQLSQHKHKVHGKIN
ncbi:zinc finger protein 181 [Culex quinquefasciatus]|uniref:zinc finger protein 181 n=1 Tax=Culex quinquefasciatus TaxID=7176 RepID=UPI0018E38E1D|nr:zinc finger protein 181 [Culex quinquefasciatus]